MKPDEIRTNETNGSTSQIALEALLYLPPLDKFIVSEAKITSYRLRLIITDRCLRVNGHSSILTDLMNSEQELQAAGEKTRLHYFFDKTFSIAYHNEEPNENIVPFFSPNLDHWFTDASVNQIGSGYGIYHLNSDTGYCGYLGKSSRIAQAEIAAILNCCFIIAQDSISNTPVVIHTDSQVAVKAIKAHSTDSLLVIECQNVIKEITERRNLTLSWVPSHSNIVGNLKADALAKKGAIDVTHGPEPFLPLAEKRCREVCENWLSTQLKEIWIFDGNAATKRFVLTPNPKLTQQLLRLSKLKMSSTIGILTGHIMLNAYLKRFGFRDDPDCNFCGRSEETSTHFLCNCPALSNIRGQIFGLDFLTPSEIGSQHVGKIFSFIKRSGRFPSNRFRPVAVPN